MMRGRGSVLLVDSALLAGWLLSAGLVVWHEQGRLWGGPGNPAASLIATIEPRTQWFGVYYQGQKIGFSQTMLVPGEYRGVPGVTVEDRGRLAFALLGTPQELEIAARAFIDADWRLQHFSASIKAPTYELRWAGRREGDELALSVSTPASTVTKRLRDPTGGAFVNGLSSWAAFRRLRVGQSGKAWILNPLALNPETVYFHVRRSELLGARQALVIEADVRGLMTTSWVTPEGEVLKETSPLGWELRQESAQEALRLPARAASAPDLLSATAVPIDRPLPDPGRIGRLTLLLEGIEAERIAVQRPWQQVLPAERAADVPRPPPGPWCLVQLERPAPGNPDAKMPAALERYQQPSLFVQSDDGRIRAQAASLTGRHADRWGQLRAIHQWVHGTLKKRLTVGLPSAVDILATPEGDCHEHTVLFTALARSTGFPTRMIAGLVFWREAFFYHAWPEVWLGEWIPMDPTLGQLVADATHLGLTEAENEELLTLGRFVGRLRARVLAVESPRGAGE
jgi:hypothetical protein